MKRTAILASMLCWIASIASHASQVSQDQAIRVAQQFMSKALNHTVTETMLSEANLAPAGIHGNHKVKEKAYYVFNTTNAFVIVAGDDRLPAVLGYSDSGTFDADNIPPALAEVLESYERSVHSMGDVAPIMLAGSQALTRVSPLLKTHWGQGAPFYHYTPMVNGKRTATGCAATALAQVMYYHRCPLHLEEDVPGYVSATHGITMNDLEFEKFPIWKNIDRDYTCSDSTLEAAMVARLMLFSGYALHNDYDLTHSSASIAILPQELTAHFGYAPTMQFVRREYYTADEWSQLILSELLAKRPVIYRAAGLESEGHAFVCDGIDINGLYHINWGWDGQCDGYYALTQLLPSTPGPCATPGEDNGYVTGAAMVTGIQSYDSIAHYENDGRLAFYNTSLARTVYTRNDASQPFEDVTMSGRFTNHTSYAAGYDIGIALYDSDNRFVKTLYNHTWSTLRPGYGATGDWPLQLDASIAAGTYTLRPVSRVHGTGEWHDCLGAHVNSVRAIVTPTTLTLETMGNNATPSLKVSGLTLNGTMQAGRQIEATATVTNNGNNPSPYIYLLLGDSTAAVAPCQLQPGATGNVNLRFTPRRAGTHSLRLALDRMGSNVVCDTIIDITSPAPATLSAHDVQVLNVMPGDSIDNGTLTITCRVSNQGDKDYSDLIVAQAHRRADYFNSALHATVSHPVTLAQGQDTTLRFDFTHLTARHQYYVTVNCYDASVLTPLATTGYYTVLGDFQTGDINANHSVDISDINAVINVTLKRIAEEVYEGRADTNEDGEVDVSDINITINVVLGKY